MSLPVGLDLPITPGSSFAATATVSSSLGSQLGILGGTASLQIGTSTGPPLVTVSTTASASGLLTLGVTFPPTGGLAVSTASGLAQLGALSSASLDLPDVSLYAANVAALEVAPTGDYILGTLALVTAAPGAFYAFSPLDPSTPNGTTVVAAAAGSGTWLWAGTLTIALTPTATAALAGYDSLAWSCVATFADGDEATILSGTTWLGPPAP